MDTSRVGMRGLKPWGNPYAMTQGPGYQIDWARTSDFFAGGSFNVQLNGAVAVGADSITVDALTRPLKIGDILRAPDVATVVVTLTANKAIGQTSLAVTALTGPIPAGTVLDAGTGKQAKTTSAAAKNATTIAVETLDTAWVSGDTATYQGGEHNLEVLADASEGATSVSVGNVQFAIADNTKLIAQVTGRLASEKFIPEATVMALDATSKKMFPRRDADTEQAIGLIASDASNSVQAAHQARSGYGTVIGNTFLFENLLPDADESGDLPSAYKTELAANTLGFTYTDYIDTRA